MKPARMVAERIEKTERCVRVSIRSTEISSEMSRYDMLDGEILTTILEG